ncbi:hypothetical protein KJ980_03405 [Patescibacteria group bacterium]|nr:hypothetical protein [Patescibacteria group bacterium]MBU4016210.1 hypothetical protein [Patescibacteria group bacterium]MBU4098668.1 hypothetical protein [Patescibacteria group bacterium]
MEEKKKLNKKAVAVLIVVVIIAIVFITGGSSGDKTVIKSENIVNPTIQAKQAEFEEMRKRVKDELESAQKTLDEAKAISEGSNSGAQLTINPEPTLTPTKEAPENKSTQHAIQEYPGFSEETMDRNFVFSCEGGSEVALWDKPTDAAGGARLRDRVQCGTLGWAFNKYYNKELDFIFYAVQTNDKRTKNTYGWITEDFLIWR